MARSSQDSLVVWGIRARLFCTIFEQGLLDCYEVLALTGETQKFGLGLASSYRLLCIGEECKTTGVLFGKTSKIADCSSRTVEDLCWLWRGYSRWRSNWPTPRFLASKLKHRASQIHQRLTWSSPKRARPSPVQRFLPLKARVSMGFLFTSSRIPLFLNYWYRVFSLWQPSSNLRSQVPADGISKYCIAVHLCGVQCASFQRL